MTKLEKASLIKNLPIAVICKNGIIKFYNADGTRNTDHATGFYNAKDLVFYTKNYRVTFN